MKTILSLVFLLFCATIFGQAWVPIGTKWVYEQPVFGPIFETKTILIECIDTVEFSGKMCSKLRIKDSGCSILYDSIQYLYAENHRVFVHNDGDFRLLYDFSTPLFSSWEVGFNVVTVGDSAKFFVVGLDAFTYNGVAKKVLLIQSNNPNYDFGSFIFEDIGSTAFLFPQFGACDPQISPLLCFYHPIFGNYGTTDCFISTKNFSQKNQLFSILPNPSNGSYLIENQEVMPDDCVEIFDFSGKKIRHFSHLNSPISIDLMDQPNGFYFAKYTTRDGIFSVKKLVKN
jgi:Secretion system C-terminal sorting domain